MTKHMGMEPTFIPTEQSMKAIGKMISRRGWEKKVGLIQHATRENIGRVKNVGRGYLNGPTARNTMENFVKIIFMEKGCIPGQIKENSSANGKITKWTETEIFCGRMKEDIKEVIKMIKKMAMGYSSGVMGVNIEGCGKIRLCFE